jgi:hypothetical protein
LKVKEIWKTPFCLSDAKIESKIMEIDIYHKILCILYSKSGLPFPEPKFCGGLEVGVTLKEIRNKFQEY